MKKKFLALVMTLSMVLSLVPMTALATGGGSTEQPIMTAEGQSASEGANGISQDSNSTTGSDKNTTGGEDSTNTPDTNTNNGNKGSESENAGGTESGSTSSGGGTEGGSTTETTESETPVEPEAPKNAAKIGNTKYETLDEAIVAAKENDVIELLKDCELTVGTINKTITINGNGKKVDVPKQTTENTALNINAPLTFNHTNVSFGNSDAWSITMNDNGVFTLDNNSVCNIKYHGIYAGKNAKINVQKESKLIIENTNYTAMMAEHGPDGKTSDRVTAQLNITGDSTVEINHTTSDNGINWFKIHVTNSFLYIKECANQGLVKCELVLDSSEAEISENAIGITGYTNDEVATLNNNSTLKMENNKEAGLFMWGGSVNVHKGNSLTISGTGSSVAEPQDESYYAALGLNSMKGSVTIEDGAEVNIIDNDVSGIYNKGTMTLGDSTVITENGKRNQRAIHGGGIDNHGTITVSAKAQVYNNHAATAGDDIYNTGTITFGAVGNDWILDDCTPEHPILGWYKDGMESNGDTSLKRWNGHGEGEDYYAVEYTAPATEVTEALALKAAHPLLYKVSYVMSGEIPEQYKNKEPAQKFYAAKSQYTIADTFPSVSGVNDNGVNGTFSFSGWSFTQGGTPVSGKQTLNEDVTLYGVWTFTKKSSGHRPSNPTVTIPDDVPTGLDLKNHYGYIIGYPVDYYTGKPTTDQTKKPVRPEGKITRAEVATIYFRMLTDENRAANWNQVSGFSDVKSSAWYNNAISTLTKAGILKGYEDGTFQPNGYITRAEFATIAIRFFSGVYEGEDLFPDIKGHWAEDYINNAANKGLVKGYEDGTFGPDRYITRAEAVTLVNRTLNRHPHNDGLHKDMLVWPDNMDTSKWYYADMQEATNSHEPDKDKTTADKEYWGKMLPIRDWEALEKEWSNANSAPGEGEVV